MKLIKRLFLASFLTIALHAPAAETKKEAAAEKPAAKEEGKPAAEKPKVKKTPFYGKVVAVTQRTLTIKSSEKGAERKITITAQTKILKEKEPVTTQEIVVGRWVGGSVEKNAEGAEVAALINLSAKQKEEKTAKAEGEAKAKTEESKPATEAKKS